MTRVVHLGRFHRCRTGTFSFCYVSTSAHYLGGMMARPLHRLQVAVHCRPHTARLCGPLPDSACLYTLCVWRPPASLMSRCQAVWAVVRTPDWVAALRSWNFKSTHIGLTSALPCPMHDPPPLHHPPYPQLPRGRGGLTGAHFTWAMRTSPDPGPPDQLGPLLGAPPLTTWPGLHRAAFSVPLCVSNGSGKKKCRTLPMCPHQAFWPGGGWCKKIWTPPPTRTHQTPPPRLPKAQPSDSPCLTTEPLLVPVVRACYEG